MVKLLAEDLKEGGVLDALDAQHSLMVSYWYWEELT